MALALSGVEWTDIRVEFADWPAMKEGENVDVSNDWMDGYLRTTGSLDTGVLTFVHLIPKSPVLQ